MHRKTSPLLLSAVIVFSFTQAFVVADNPAFAATGNPVLATTGNPVLAATGNSVLAATGNPVLAATGNPVLAATGNPVLATTGNPVLAATGNPVLATTGNPVIAATGNPVLAATGNPPSDSPTVSGDSAAAMEGTAGSTRSGESAEKTTAQPAAGGGLRLQGGVSHAESLPELPDGLQVGKVFSEDLLPKTNGQGNNVFYYIPPWYAGQKHIEDEMIVFRHNFLTGESTTPNQRQLNRQDSQSGFQVDANGGIWDFKHVPTIRRVESDFCNAVLYVKNLIPLTGNDNQIVIKFELISISVDKDTNRILKIDQQEQINTTTSPMPGILHTDVSAKTFGPDGKPLRQEQAVLMGKIVKPFQKTDFADGIDLRPLFRDYLVSHNLANLVPPDIAKLGQ